jgi:hypothetical protein
MRTIFYWILGAALLLGPGVSAQDHGKKGDVENIVGVMSDEVVQARMKALGYTNVKVQKKHELQYHIDAMKDGKPVFLEMHPQTGAVKQFATPQLREQHVRTMPLAPGPEVRKERN